jgi:hypothetical protein
MSPEIILVAVLGALILFVLVRVSLTLNEIGASLRKLARKKAGPEKKAASALLHEKESLRQAEASSEAGSEAEVVAAIASARFELDRTRTSEETKR